MKYFSQYPVISPFSPETHSFLKWWYGEDNLFRGNAAKVSYKRNKGNFSIKTVFKGSLMYVVDGEEKLVEPGTFLVVNAGTQYDCENLENSPVEDVCLQLTNESIAEAFVALGASDELLLGIGQEKANADLQLETLSFSDAVFENLLKAIAEPTLSAIQREELKCKLLRYYFKTFYADRLRQYRRIENESTVTKREILKRIHLAKDFLHSNYAYPINLQQVAAAACLSTSHLIKKFNEVLHTTPYQYLRGLRLQKAVYLLQHTAAPVEEITRKLGFESTSSFIRAFRERYNYTPLSLRKKTALSARQENW